MSPAEDKPKNQPHVNNIENLEQYMLYNKGQIVQRLKQLVKNKGMITAYADNGVSMNTALVGILTENDLLVLDYGVDESLVQQIINSKRVIFKTQFEGINIQFTTNSLTKAKYQNEPAIAVPIPANLLWLQRRQSFRVRIPLGMPAYCDIPAQDGSTIRLRIFDISAGGISVSDEGMKISGDSGLIYSNCQLDLPGFGRITLSLETRNCFKIKKTDPAQGQRCGFSFHQMGMTDEAAIMRYIHSVETLRKRTED